MMIEGDWRASCHLWDMCAMAGQSGMRDLEAFKRKLRLFACACCRQVWHLLDGPSRRAVEVAERFADRQARRAELLGAMAAITPDYSSKRRDLGREAAWNAACAPDRPNRSMDFADMHAMNAGCLVEQLVAARGGEQAGGQTRSVLAHLFRDVMGNPFAPPTSADLSRLKKTHPAFVLARQMYQTGDFGEMPALADRLEQAGCASGEVLGHCRGPGPHARGCCGNGPGLDRPGRCGSPTHGRESP